MTVLVGRLASGMTPQQHRLAAQAGMAHTGALLSVTGVVSGLLFAKTTGMTGSLGTGQAWIAGTSAADQGGYAVTVDPADSLTFADGDATRDRIDLVVLEVKDNTFDGSGLTLGRSRVVQGAYPVSGAPLVPATPASCVALWTQRVNHGTNAGSGGIDPSLLVDVRVPTAAIGAPIPVVNQAARDALATDEPLAVYRLDTHVVERWNGAFWQRNGLPAANLTHKPRRLFNRLVTFSLANNANTPVGSWTADTGDDGDGVITYSNPIVTVSVGGRYRIRFLLVFAGNVTGVRTIAIYKNPVITAGLIASGTALVIDTIPGQAAGHSIDAEVDAVLAAGDTLAVACSQTSGGALVCGSATAGFDLWQIIREDD